MFDQTSATICNVHAFDARADLNCAQRYIGAIDDRIDHDLTGLSRASLWRVSAQILFDEDARVYTLEQSGFMLAGCHIKSDGDGLFELKGLFRGRYVNSAAPRLVTYYAIADTARINGDDTRFHAAVRVYPDGWRDSHGRLRHENLASRRIFESELGFVADPKPQEHAWRGDYFDAHLEDSLEPGRAAYRNLTLRSSRETVRLARERLALMSSVAAE
jgi:hypothetical protein